MVECSLILRGPCVLMDIGWKVYCDGRLEYLASLHVAAIFLVPVLRHMSWQMCKWQLHSKLLACLPAMESVSCHLGISNLHGSRPVGSFETEMNALATTSFKTWCLSPLPGACLQTRLWVPHASTCAQHHIIIIIIIIIGSNKSQHTSWAVVETVTDACTPFSYILWLAHRTCWYWLIHHHDLLVLIVGYSNIRHPYNDVSCQCIVTKANVWIFTIIVIIIEFFEVA